MTRRLSDDFVSCAICGDTPGGYEDMDFIYDEGEKNRRFEYRESKSAIWFRDQGFQEFAACGSSRCEKALIRKLNNAKFIKSTRGKRDRGGYSPSSSSRSDESSLNDSLLEEEDEEQSSFLDEEEDDSVCPECGEDREDEPSRCDACGGFFCLLCCAAWDLVFDSCVCEERDEEEEEEEEEETCVYCNKSVVGKPPEEVIQCQSCDVNCCSLGCWGFCGEECEECHAWWCDDDKCLQAAGFVQCTQCERQWCPDDVWRAFFAENKKGANRCADCLAEPDEDEDPDKECPSFHVLS